MALHILNKTLSHSAADDCLAAITEGDALLLTEDGVYVALSPAQEVLQRVGRNALFLLKADVEARGLVGRLAADINIIDDDGVVDLCCQYSPVVSWF